MGSYPVGQRGPGELAGIQGQLARSRGRVHCNGQSWASSATGLAGTNAELPTGLWHKPAREVKGKEKGCLSCLVSLQGFRRPRHYYWNKEQHFNFSRVSRANSCSLPAPWVWHSSIGWPLESSCPLARCAALQHARGTCLLRGTRDAAYTVKADVLITGEGIAKSQRTSLLSS